MSGAPNNTHTDGRVAVTRAGLQTFPYLISRPVRQQDLEQPFLRQDGLVGNIDDDIACGACRWSEWKRRKVLDTQQQ